MTETVSKNMLFIFHHGHRRGEVSRDCRLRLDAAKHFAIGYPECVVLFVGGNGIDGSVDMERYWKWEPPSLPNPVEMMGSANNTADAVRDIAMKLSERTDVRDVTLISNAYHLRRIRYFCDRLRLQVRILAAEDILMNDAERRDSVRGYMDSPRYAVHRIVESAVLFYARAIDHGQTLVRWWRRGTRIFK